MFPLWVKKRPTIFFVQNFSKCRWSFFDSQCRIIENCLHIPVTVSGLLPAFGCSHGHEIPSTVLAVHKHHLITNAIKDYISSTCSLCLLTVHSTSSSSGWCFRLCHSTNSRLHSVHPSSRSRTQEYGEKVYSRKETEMQGNECSDEKF